ALASVQSFEIASGVVSTGLATTGTGKARPKPVAISFACSATVLRVSSPYKCWLPVANQSSNFAKSIIAPPRYWLTEKFSVNADRRSLQLCLWRGFLAAMPRFIGAFLRGASKNEECPMNGGSKAHAIDRYNNSHDPQMIRKIVSFAIHQPLFMALF